MKLPLNKQCYRLPAVRVVALLALAVPATPGVLALDSDREQPAVIDADEVDMDFKTGVRTYRGNVYLQQGSIRLKADLVVAYFEDAKLQRATATGKPAIFRQRPEGKEHDVIGKGREMVLDQIKSTVTLITNASVEQESNIITGNTIEYNMTTEQVKIRGGYTGAPAAGTGESAAGGGDAAQPEIPAGGTRPRLVIPPRTESKTE